MLPPPQLTGAAAANPRSIFSPLAMAYLGDAVWEAHTRALELELDLMQQQGQQSGSQQVLQTQSHPAAGPGRLQPPAVASSEAGTSGSSTGSSGKSHNNVKDETAREVEASRSSSSHDVGGGGGSSANSSSRGGAVQAAALRHLAGLTRQQRKLWASAAFQAQVFDALTGGGLALPLLASPRPSPPAAASSSSDQPDQTETAADVITPSASAATGSGAGSPTSASAPPASPAVAADADTATASKPGTNSALSAAFTPTRPQQLLVLTAAEADVLRWGRNAAVGSIPKSVTAGDYKKATAVEVLVAHLYLTAPERCAQLVRAAVSAVPLPP
ncbi:hypothetical protein HYH02_014568 [Chlamydomonas schloesseri]|uniref:RNase III domain-containing protein n=1 Tax=Chlamydomonas schloesseri TaxID=2026947 RepID=A0A835SHZ1_9CHLO|nr:hypothetical protein HYH02_014568 [Chlamydomonas schloesseri]|eukprot:KAG2427522.1 hypothetical protein HYH02_014568 [Chlamydomonas schloesseri]